MGRKREQGRRPTGAGRPVARKSDRDPAARARAKDLLRTSGEALEAGDHALGRARLEEAYAADPTFVEPALALASLLASEGDREAALAAADEAVRRGRAIVDRIPPKPGSPVWWHDEATRPYMKALVGRAFRFLEDGHALRAAGELDAVFELEPDLDPLQAGVFAAEARLHAGDPMAALAAYARLEEQPAVSFGRALALLRTAQRHEALVSLWLALLVNPALADSLLGPLPLAGLDRNRLAAEPDEAADIVARTGGLWTDDERQVARLIVEAASFREDVLAFGLLASELDAAESEPDARRALAAIETLLTASRVEQAIAPLLVALDARPLGGRRLPLA